MDGEVAQLAALVISANHRLTHADDPMHWFADQRAFARSGEIRFEIATKNTAGPAQMRTIAQSPRDWLEQLPASGTVRACLGFERQDEEAAEGERIPDRISAGFAGGGSRWVMTTQTANGDTLGWRATWKAAFRNARDGRLWAVRYTATAGAPQLPPRDIVAAATELRHALAEMSEFAWSYGAKEANKRFTSALALLEGAPDPLAYPPKVGPADTLSHEARCLLRAAQRGWMFDDMSGWGDLKVDEDTLRDHARRAEALYDAVTSAMVAAVNSSAPSFRAASG